VCSVQLLNNVQTRSCMVCQQPTGQLQNDALPGDMISKCGRVREEWACVLCECVCTRECICVRTHAHACLPACKHWPYVPTYLGVAAASQKVCRRITRQNVVIFAQRIRQRLGDRCTDSGIAGWGGLCRCKHQSQIEMEQRNALCPVDCAAT
jgi:hypothetical protein